MIINLTTNALIINSPINFEKNYKNWAYSLALCTLIILGVSPALDPIVSSHTIMCSNIKIALETTS